MTFETILRDALAEVADDAEPVPGLATAVLRRARRRSTVVRGLLAAGLAAVAIPAGVIGFGPGGGDGGTVAADGAGTDILPAPEWRELTDGELAAAHERCALYPHEAVAAATWEPARGLRLTEPGGIGAAATWVLSSSGGHDRIECVLDGSGKPIALGLMIQTRRGADTDLVTAIGAAAGVGPFTEPVTRVTVQEEDGPERDAILWDGFWFYPMTRTSLPEQSCRSMVQNPGPGGSGPVVAVPGPPVDVTMRAYDGDGRVIWHNSSTVQPRGCRE